MGIGGQAAEVIDHGPVGDIMVGTWKIGMGVTEAVGLGPKDGRWLLFIGCAVAGDDREHVASDI